MAFDNLKGKTFTAVTSSAGIEHKDLYRKTPSVLRQGAKEKTNGGFFNYDLILSASDKNLGANFYADDAVIVEVDSASKEVGVYITASVFRDNMNDFLQKTAGFNSASYQQISASFFSQIGNAVSNIPNSDAYVGILAAPFESGSVGSGSAIIEPVTSSIEIIEAPGLAFNTAGNLRQRKTTYLNSSTNFTNAHFFFNTDQALAASNDSKKFGDAQQESASNALIAAGKTHLTRSFTSHTNVESYRQFYYVQPKPITKWSIAMSSSNNTASFFALTASFSGAADFGVTSGSSLGFVIESSSIAPRFYNGTNHGGTGDKTDGAWNFVVQKSIIEGEGEFASGEDNYAGDTGANVAFTPQQLLVWYPSYYTYANVRSASFYFTSYPSDMQQSNVGARTKSLVTGSISSSEAIGTGELRTLYWLNHTYTSSFTASFSNFTRDQLKNQTAGADHFQLPYMNTSLRRFGQKNSETNASHLWKDTSLSIPADEGYYVHSSSFTQASKNQMSASLGSANHTSSFFVMGSFRHKFTGLGGSTRNYTASQFDDPSVNDQTWMSHHPIASCMFLKRYDDEVFIYQPKDGQAVISESVG